MERITEFWRWLPAFRAVADEEHLTRAARSLCVSPSAVSRGIALLEESVGEHLFDRRGRRLSLTRAGQTMLEATRSAMRIVHDGLLNATATTFVGTTRISAPPPLAPVMAEALLALKRSHPSLEPELVSADDAELDSLILRGDLDMALTSRADRLPHIARRLVANLTNRVYCGPNHPLYEREFAGLDELVDHPFVAFGRSAKDTDPWPPEIERRTPFVVDDVFVAAGICASGELLATLPDILVTSMSSEPPLWRIPVDCVPATPIYALSRVALTDNNLAESLIEMAQRALARASRAS